MKKKGKKDDKKGKGASEGWPGMNQPDQMACAVSPALSVSLTIIACFLFALSQ